MPQTSAPVTIKRRVLFRLAFCCVSMPMVAASARRVEAQQTFDLLLPADAALAARRLELAQPPQTAALATAILHGTVVDEDDALIPNARVSLDSADGKIHLTTVTNSSGRFNFTRLPAGAFTITAEASGLSPESVDLTLLPGQELDLAFINLPPATTTATVDVVSSQHEAAEAELREEYHQRLLGVLPNFYVSYNWHAAPLSSGQKARLAYRSLIDPTNFVISGIIAGVQLENNSLAGYGTGYAGFFNRFAASYGNEFVGTVLGGYVFPVVFRQDPRYFYRGVGTVRSRFLYALAAAVISRGDNGKWQPAYAAIAGDFTAGAISNLYYPPANRTGVSLTLANGFIAIGSDAIGNLVQEFVFKHVTPHVPKHPPPPAASPTP